MDGLKDMDQYMSALKICYSYLTSELEEYNDWFHRYNQKFDKLFREYDNKLLAGLDAEKSMQRLMSELDKLKSKKGIKKRVKQETMEESFRHSKIPYEQKEELRSLLEGKIVTDALKKITQEYCKAYNKRKRYIVKKNGNRTDSTEKLEITDKELLVDVFKILNEEYKDINMLAAKKIEFLFNHSIHNKKDYTSLQAYLENLQRGQNYSKFLCRAKVNAKYDLTTEQERMLAAMITGDDIAETFTKLIGKIKSLETMDEHQKSTTAIKPLDSPEIDEALIPEDIYTEPTKQDYENTPKKPDENDRFSSRYKYIIELLESPLLTANDKIEMFQHMLYIAKELENHIYEYNRISGKFPTKHTEVERSKYAIYQEHNPLELLEKYQEKLEKINEGKRHLSPEQQEQLATFPNMKNIVDNVNERIMQDIISKYSQSMIYDNDIITFELSNRLILMNEDEIKSFYHNFLSNYHFDFDLESLASIQHAFVSAVLNQKATTEDDNLNDLTGSLKQAARYTICLELFDEMPKTKDTETGIIKAYEIESFIDGCYDLPQETKAGLARALAEYQLRHGNNDEVTSSYDAPKGGGKK